MARFSTTKSSVFRQAGVLFVLGQTAPGKPINPEADGYEGPEGYRELALRASAVLDLYDETQRDGEPPVDEVEVYAAEVACKLRRDRATGHRVVIGIIRGHRISKAVRQLQRRLLRALATIAAEASNDVSQSALDPIAHAHEAAPN